MKCKWLRVVPLAIILAACAGTPGPESPSSGDADLNTRTTDQQTQKETKNGSGVIGSLVGLPGTSTPYTDLPGWKLSFEEQFDTPAAEGQFTTVYGLRFGTYNNGDTSRRGKYSPEVISVANGVLSEHIFTSPDNIHHVAAILPKLSTVGKRGDVLSGRFSVRWRGDQLHTYKIAWLLWPLSGSNIIDGEIDGPEHNLDTVIKGFMHPVGNTVKQTVFKSNTLGGDWHEWTIEWFAGKSLKMILDGVQVGPIPTSFVPANLMHWVLQTETILDKTIPIDPLENGIVQIDSLAYWTPA